VSHGPSRAGGDRTGSSTGRTGHRSTAASILRRRAELARPPLPGPVRHEPQTPAGLRRGACAPGPCFRGRCATSLGLGAATATSAASVHPQHPPVQVRALRQSLERACVPVPSINRRTRINHGNRRVSPPAVTPVMPCDGCDERGQAGAVTDHRRLYGQPTGRPDDGTLDAFPSCGPCVPRPTRPRFAGRVPAAGGPR
jgi:hypothetical protein